MANSEMRPFKPDEIPKLMAALKGQNYETRNKALISLGVCTGFRISELTALRVDDVYYFGEIKDRIKLPKRLMKGKQPRHPKTIFPQAKILLLDWINEMRELQTVTRRSYLFTSRRTGKLSATSCWRIIKTAAEDAGIPTYGVGTHSLRKTFANAVYDYWDKQARNGARVEPMRMVQLELGHASIDDTYKYMAFKIEEKPDDVFEDYDFLFDGNATEDLENSLI